MLKGMARYKDSNFERVVHIDVETYSELDLTKVGAHRYAMHESTELLMAAWCFEDDPESMYFWDYTMSNAKLQELLDVVRNPNYLKKAFNAQFERLIFHHVCGIKSKYWQWRCVMAKSYQMSFSGGLANVGTALGFDEEKLKDKSGKALITRFSKPRKPTKVDKNTRHDAFTHPDLFNEFGTYNRQDVVAETAIDKRISMSRFYVPDYESRVYALDQQINDRGITIDVDFVNAAIEMATIRKEQIISEMRELTGLDNPGSPKQLQEWLKLRGYPFDDLRADTVSKVIKEFPDNGVTEEAVTALKMRQSSAKSSISKYSTMLDVMDPITHVVRGTTQYCGASRTGRFAGRLIQTQNFVRTPKHFENVENVLLAKEMILKGRVDALDLFVGEPMDALAGLLRAALIPAKGKKFVVADLSSIESVVIGWLTNCRWFLNTLKAKRDLYRSFAAEWLKIPYEDTLPHRGKAKPATLGCGYRLGGGELIDGKKTGLWGYGENMGVYLTREESHDSVRAFRELCPEIVDSWTAIEKCVYKTIATHETTRWRCLKFGISKPFLYIELPSGRRLYYYKPRVEMVPKKNRKGETYFRQEIRYEGKQETGKKWGTLTTHGGKLVENIVQAIARDVLVAGLFEAEKAGFRTVFHVHDEIVTEVDIDSPLSVRDLEICMTKELDWAPGLHLGAAGWEGYFYRKD